MNNTPPKQPKSPSDPIRAIPPTIQVLAFIFVLFSIVIVHLLGA